MEPEDEKPRIEIKDWKYSEEIFTIPQLTKDWNNETIDKFVKTVSNTYIEYKFKIVAITKNLIKYNDGNVYEYSIIFKYKDK